MTQRISVKKDLDPIVSRINHMTNNPTDPYTRGEDGKYRANVGNYHLDIAYGGYALYQMSNESGGARDVLQVGHVPARELQRLMFAYIAGIIDARGD